MKKIIILFIFLNLSMNVESQIMFQKTYGTSYEEVSSYIKQTSDRGYISTGYIHAGVTSMYLLKMDSLGGVSWTKNYVASSWGPIGYNVLQTYDGGYAVVGLTGSGVGLFKTDVNGDSVWNKEFYGLNNIEGFSIYQTLDSGYVIIGTSLSYASATGFNYDGIIIKTDVNGNLQWSKNYRNASYFEGYNDIVDGIQTSDGGYALVGSTTLPYVSWGTGYNYDVYIIKTNSLGDTLWTKSYGGGMYFDNKGKSINQTSDGGYIIGANTSSNGGISKALVIKIDSVGNFIWSKAYGGTNDYLLKTVQQTPDGGYIISGTNNMTPSATNYYPYLIRTNSIGDTLWTRNYGPLSSAINTSGYSSCASELLTSDGGYLLETNILTFQLTADVYVIKTDMNGNSGCYERNLGMTVSAPVNIPRAQLTQVISPAILSRNPVLAISSSGATENGNCLTIGVDEINNDNLLTIYPNPFSSFTTISLNSEQKNATLKIVNMIGEEVKVMNFSGTQVVIDKGEIRSGLYLLQIIDQNKTIINKKIIIQ